MEKLYLFDSFAMIFRAYFALQKNPLINSKGQNVSAITGFLNTLYEIITKYKPTHIACAFDSTEPTIRHEAFEAYKANRSETPEDIIFSIPYIKAIIKGFNIPILEVPGYEADDIIGAIAMQAEQHNIETYIVTMDKDLGQLVSDKTFIHRPPYMGKPAQIYGVQEICERWEIDNPKQLIDILGLMGDAVDNIPGVAGIGEKTAQKLIKDFGSIEGIYENIEQIKGKLKDKLVEQKEQAYMSKSLATVELNVPVEFHIETFKIQEKNTVELAEIFAELEFRTQAKRILGDSYNLVEEKNKASINNNQQFDLFSSISETTSATENISNNKNLYNTEHQYSLIDSENKLAELIQKIAKEKSICFDTETTSLNTFESELVGISISLKENEGFYIPCPTNKQQTQAIIEQLRPILENENITKIGQNIKYDLLVLKNYNIELKGILWDTMLAHYLIEPDARHGMDILAENYLNYQTISIEELIGKKGKNQGNMRDVPIEKIKDYAIEDADITLQLQQIFKKEIDQTHLENLFYNVETKLITVLADMEREGINVDVPFLQQYSSEIQEELIQLQDTIYKKSGTTFNIDSPKQLGEILFEHLKIPYQGKKTKTGQYSTDEATLQKFFDKHPIIQSILDYREFTKLKSTYVDAIPNLINPLTNRIHTTYNQTSVATGRLSSINPNLQNIPIRTERGKQIRKAFIPRDENYTLLSADYSQIELRIVASISGDENMMEAFRQQQDIHSATAARVFNVSLEEVSSEMRRKAKMVNFGIIYGISAFGLAQRLGTGRNEAAELIEEYFKQYPKIKNYMDNTILFAQQNGYVETLLKRRNYIRDINSENYTIRGFAERIAINAPIQGSAADMIKVAMIDIHQQLKSLKCHSKLLLQVHDELILDVHKSEKEIIEKIVISSMKNALPLNIPVEVSCGWGNNWLEAH
ncbi:MAG TPA: DNA polymerase I [Chitinophagales bacterium]|nr:DNA polymerase I [Chitinophagales bacterium]MCB9075403.1 DNA polymerase I [Chitinophagales bacterium]HMU98785.1 DNA polymerase I [Chitinophagales bacterium]HMV02201.1 DNA polymerase I [Chitinophagales bacterium]HMW93346.1 DNA polymerase I [Chitinophagales bacterium]